MSDERTNETAPMRRTEARLGRPLREYLAERYEHDGLSTTEIGRQLGLSSATIRRWLIRLGIELRFPGQRGKVS